MENTKADSDETKSAAVATSGDQNPNNSQTAAVEEQPGSDAVENGTRQSSSNTRTPFTNLSQVDADLALARTLQEQERAYMMLRLNGNGNGYGGWGAGGYVLEDGEDFDDLSDDEYDGLDAEVGEEGEEDIDDDEDEDDDDEEDDEEEDEDEEEEDEEDEEEDAFDVHAHAEDGEDNDSSDGVDLDPASFPNDEAYARALQDAEDREMAARLLALAGINDRAVEVEDMEDHGDNSQDTWEEVDPDELSYEELLALGEIVGTESRGLSADTIASLPSVNYKMQSAQDGNNDSCVICRLDYEDEDTLTVLSCKHSYHSECLHNWLRINKVCPVCSAEVPSSASGNNS